jgi:hypothetical protein
VESNATALELDPTKGRNEHFCTESVRAVSVDAADQGIDQRIEHSLTEPAAYERSDTLVVELSPSSDQGFRSDSEFVSRRQQTR